MQVPHEMMQHMHPPQAPPQVAAAHVAPLEQHQQTGTAAQVAVVSTQPHTSFSQMSNLIAAPPPHLQPGAGMGGVGVGVSPGGLAEPAKQPAQREKRKHAISIIHPDTMEDILENMYNDPSSSSSGRTGGGGGGASSANSTASTAVSSAGTPGPAVPVSAQPVSTPSHMGESQDYAEYQPQQQQQPPQPTQPAQEMVVPAAMVGQMPPPQHLHHQPPPPMQLAGHELIRVPNHQQQVPQPPQQAVVPGGPLPPTHPHDIYGGLKMMNHSHPKSHAFRKLFLNLFNSVKLLCHQSR